MPRRVLPSDNHLGLTTVGIPVLNLNQIQHNKYIGGFTRKPSGFEAFSCGDFPSPQLSIAITGKLMTEENGIRRSITEADLKKWQPMDIVNRVYTGRGVAIATSPISRKPILKLSQQKPPKLDINSWNSVVLFTQLFITGVVVQRKVRDKLTTAQQALFDPIVQPGSKELNIVADYFCNFIEAGLAKEP